MDTDVVLNSYNQFANLTLYHIDLPEFAEIKLRAIAPPGGHFFLKKNFGSDKLPSENTLKMTGGDVD